MDTIDRILHGELAPLRCDTELDRYASWPLQMPEEPLETAIARGAEADRPAWVFVAGYQAAIRACFPEAVLGKWRCFAASEPAAGPAAALRECEPGDWRIDGAKSWIAGARHVDQLVVLVGRGTERRIVLVPRAAPGLEITDPGPRRLLPELSQGTAQLLDVRVDAPVPAVARIDRFGRSERFFVTAAIGSCALANLCRARDRSGALDPLAEEIAHVLTKAVPLASAIGSAEAATDFDTFGTTIAALAERFVEHPGLTPEFRARWLGDRRLLHAFAVPRT